jgi:hypothetical protein
LRAPWEKKTGFLVAVAMKNDGFRKGATHFDLY